MINLTLDNKQFPLSYKGEVIYQICTCILNVQSKSKPKVIRDRISLITLFLRLEFH